jgi:sulfite exporter TauE/SafE/copper chaperone CopZ
MNQQKYQFHIRGMHCKGCTLLTESELKEFPYVVDVKASLHSSLVEVTGDFDKRNREQVAEEMNAVLAKHGYTLSTDGFDKLTGAKIKEKANWKEFRIALPITAAFVLLYILLQKLGLVNLVQAGRISFGTAFVIGIIASLSSCMAVVGGLVLSMSATFAKEGDKVRPQVMFHLGRILSFFVLGGVIGAIGSAFTLGTAGSFILGVIIALVMFVLGLNLLDVFPWARKLQPGMPRFLSRRAFGVSKLNHTRPTEGLQSFGRALTPALVGLATFFLPCGFTQSMQIYALSTGGFNQGALVMLSFALGTLPVLGILSFSSFSIQKSSKAGIFFKTAGLVVILFALFNLINALVVINILPPIFNF